MSRLLRLQVLAFSWTQTALHSVGSLAAAAKCRLMRGTTCRLQATRDADPSFDDYMFSHCGPCMHLLPAAYMPCLSSSGKWASTTRSRSGGNA